MFLSKIKDKYNKMSLVAKAGIWFAFCTMIQKSVAFLTVPIFTRIMPTNEYGLYSTYLSWYTIITVICTLDMHNCIYMNKITKSSNEKDKDMEAIPLLSLSCIITTILFVIYLIFNQAINKVTGLSTPLICLMFLQIFFDPVINFWLVRQKFEYKYRNIIIRTILIVSLNAILGIIFVLIAKSSQAVARVCSIVLVQIVFGLMFYYYFFGKTHKIFSCKDWKHVLKVQLPLLPHSLSLTILNSADRIMINSIIGSAEAAIYSVAYSAGFVVNVFKNSIVDAIRPEIYKSIKNKDYVKINKTFKSLSILIFIIIFSFIMLAPEAIKIMAPKNYYEAIYIIPPVAASTFFTFMFAMFSYISLYYEKTKRIMVSSISVAIINVVLNFIFIPIFGYLAAGYTTLVSYILLAMMHYFIMKQVSKKELQNTKIFDIKYICTMSGITLLSSIGITFIYDYFLFRYILLVIIILVVILRRKKIINLYKNLK